MATMTESGEYRVYHRDESSAPEAHLGIENADCGGVGDDEYGGPWFYAPADWDYPEAFSAGYLSEDSAREAALDWEEEMLAEAGLEPEERPQPCTCTICHQYTADIRFHRCPGDCRQNERN